MTTRSIGNLVPNLWFPSISPEQALSSPLSLSVEPLDIIINNETQLPDPNPDQMPLQTSPKPDQKLADLRHASGFSEHKTETKRIRHPGAWYSPGGTPSDVTGGMG